MALGLQSSRQTQVSSTAVKFIMRPTVALGLISLIWLSGCTERADPSWHIQTVDSRGDVGEYTSLALDSRGYPHISYQDLDFGLEDDAKGQSYLKYAVWKGSSWDIQTVDSAGQACWEPSLRLDGSGLAHISYTGGGLKYAAWNGSCWDIQTVDRVGNFSSLALDSSGYPHISYYDFANRDLKYAVWNGSSWDIETVDSEGRVGFYCSLALDPSDYPHISYGAFDTSLGEREFNTDLKYATWDGSVWNTHTVDSALTMVHGISLAVDGNGYAHIAYWDSDNLKYAAWNGDSWHIQTADSTSGGGEYTSLSLDSNGYAHISYQDIDFDDWDDPKGGLKYAYWNGSSWDIETVDSEGLAGWHTSLAIDSSDRAHISYGAIDLNQGDDRPIYLKYATNAPPAIER